MTNVFESQSPDSVNVYTPVVEEVEAVLVTLENGEEVASWCGGMYFPPVEGDDLAVHGVALTMLGRPVMVSPGHYIVRKLHEGEYVFYGMTAEKFSQRFNLKR